MNLFFKLYDKLKKIIFITFGNTSRYQNAIKRICTEAYNFGFEKIIPYNEFFLDFKIFDLTQMENTRGYGFWTWKPWVLKETIKNAKYGDIIVYADAGCQIKNTPKTKARFQEYITMLDDHKSWIRFSMNHIKENSFTTDAVFNYFNVKDSTNHYMATIHILRVCENSLALADAWCDIAIHTELFTDKYNKDTTRSDFVDHRHDQSVFSVLCKTLPYKNMIISIDDPTNPSATSVEPFISARIRN